MLSIAEGSFEVFVVFQRAPGGNPALFHTHTYTHTCFHTQAHTPRVNGREGLKQHAAVCSAGRIIGGIDGEDPCARFSAAMLVSQQAGSPERERQIMRRLKRTCIRSWRSSSRFDRLMHVHMRRTNAGPE